MMKRNSGLCFLLFVWMLSASSVARSQVIVESVVAIIGNEVLYLSDIENAVLDLRRNGNRTSAEDLRCRVLNELLISKLFLDQARIDSIQVTPDMV